MNTNIDISNQLKNYVDTTDDLTVKNILEMLELKNSSLWFSNEVPQDVYKEVDSIESEENLLSFEQVKQLYPHWFKN